MTPQDKDTLKPGTDLFGYRVIEFTGEGNWSYVYKAQHPKLPMLVAVKQLKPEWVQDQEALERFLREADIVARLNHPNVVTIYDLQHDEKTGAHYIITEFTERGTLADYLKMAPEGLSIDDILHMTMGICSGLEAIHRRDIVHRDIKPSNILLFDVGESRDTPKVSDFGIARGPASMGGGVRQSSGVYGSLFYMSPEQLDEDVQVDCRSDLYSLGILLYELLTGQVPFTGEDQQVFWEHLYAPLEPPSKLREDIPEALEQIVIRALRKDRSDRYQSAADMHEALKAVQDISIRREREQKFETLLAQGLTHLREEEWDESVEALRQAEVLKPGDEQALAGLQQARKQQNLDRLYELGVQHLKERNWEEARDYLAEVISHEPNYQDGRAREQLERATRELERERSQRDLLVQYRSGMGHFRGQQWAQAIIELERVVARDPEFRDALARLEEARQYRRAGQLFERAQSHKEREEWEEAVYLLEDAEALDPPHINVAEELESARRKWAEARAEQRLARWYDEGMAHLTRGELELAGASFEKIVSYQADYRDVADRLNEIGERTRLLGLFERASGYERNKEWEQAIAIYREILNLDPLNREATRRLMRAQDRAEWGDRRWFHRVAVVAQTWWEKQDHRVKLILMGMLGAIVPVFLVLILLVGGVDPSKIDIAATAETSELLNGDFEDGFAHWQHGGKLDQAVACDGDGNGCYAVLGNPEYECFGGVPVGEAWIKQSFDVPQAVSPTLSLRYRVFSYDLDLEDTFQVYVNGEPLSDSLGNFEWSESSCTRDVWDSNWQDLTLPLSVYRGKEIKVSFHNTNGLQPHYNTWTYIDDVSIDQNQ
jgi:serine/threonine protein kinase